MINYLPSIFGSADPQAQGRLDNMEAQTDRDTESATLINKETEGAVKTKLGAIGANV